MYSQGNGGLRPRVFPPLHQGLIGGTDGGASMENIAKGQKLSRGEAFDTVRPPRHVVRVRWQDVRVARRERQLGYVWGTLSGQPFQGVDVFGNLVPP